MLFKLPRDLGVALDEASLLGVEFDQTRRLAAITVDVLTLPADDGPAPADRRRQLVLHSVGRIAASLRNGLWSDRSASVTSFSLMNLSDVVRSFDQLPIYGADTLVDSAEDSIAEFSDRLSLDWTIVPHSPHSLSLFQEAPDRHLDLWIWFDSLEVFDSAYNEISLEDFVAGGRRWWSGLRTGDPRTKGFGIIPLQ